jgi:small-conductance mechanosensitive channel
VSGDCPPEETPQGEPGFRFMMSDRDKAWEKINDARIEFAKLRHDWLKHLTTLCTGSILIISALTGSVFNDTSFLWGWLIPVSLVLLLLAVILLGFSMWYWQNWAERSCVFWYLQADEGHEVAEDLNTIEAISLQSERISSLLVSAGTICFVFGVVSFCIFALRNAGALF